MTQPLHDSAADDQPLSDAALWPLDPDVTYLNHGAFGSCPRAVLEYQRELRDRLEAQPVRFYVREMESLLDAARTKLANFVGAAPQDLVMVQGATAGVNAVLRSLALKPGDELLVTDHEYNASRNALNYAAEVAGATVVVAPVPFPLRDEDEIVEAILSAVTPRTRLALFDHVTSQTALIFPVERLVRELSARGIETLIDGAHAPGMVPLNLSKLGATYYTGNCHKWLCGPKASGFLYVQRDRQAQIRPLVISHGANSARTDRSRYLIEFGWVGTADPSPFLAMPAALELLASLLPGGWEAVIRANHELAVKGRQMLCDALQIEPPCPAHLLGSMAAIPLPPELSGGALESPLYLGRVQNELWNRHGIEVPVIPWPDASRSLLRISAQLYNRPRDYAKLAEALLSIAAAGSR